MKKQNIISISDIIPFDVLNQIGDKTKNNTEHTLTHNVETGTNVSALIPTIEISEKVKFMKHFFKLAILIALTFMFSVILSAQENIPAYIWVTDGAFSQHDPGFNKANLADVSTTVQILEEDNYSLKAGDFAEGSLYMAGLDSNNTSYFDRLFSVNTQTGELTLIGDLELLHNIPPYGDIEGRATGMAYDENSQTMYISAWHRIVSPIDTTITKLYTVNLTDASVEEIGLIFDANSPEAEYRLNAGIACDNDGNLYGASYEEDKLYSINKTTGAATEIGDLGIDYTFSDYNDLAYDHTHNVLYGSLYRDDAPQPYNSDIFTINTTTGEATYIEQSDTEIGAFAIPKMYSATFVIEDEETNPINDATISINIVTNQNWTKQTGTDGTALFQSFDNGQYNYEVVRTGYATETGTITITNQEEEIIVTMTVENFENDIIQFDVLNQVGNEIINTIDHTVTLNVETGTDVSALTPTIEISEFATIDPANGTTQDFTESVEYTVTAGDGVEQIWTVTITEVLSSEDDLIPSVTKLIGNYPNPFNPTTTISFQINNQQNEQAELSIYNLKGQKVKKYEIRNWKSGMNEIVWSGDDDSGKPVASGIYYYKLKVGAYSQTKKMMLMK